MRQKYVMGNWKMHGNFSSISILLQGLNAWENSTARMVVFPPYLYLQETRDLLKDTNIFYGAQNVYPEVSGAYTGEVSGPMLKDLGCKYVIIGHSERRHIFGESDELIARKFKHVKECDMIPVLCIGETAKERDSGQTEDVLLRQLMTAVKLEGSSFKDSIISYEPVWAIGTGNTAHPKQIQENHNFIRNCILNYEEDVAENAIAENSIAKNKDSQQLGFRRGANERDEGVYTGYMTDGERDCNKAENSIAKSISILYGGSVTPDIAPILASLNDVDGFLVGGASLNAGSFLGITGCIN